MNNRHAKVCYSVFIVSTFINCSHAQNDFSRTIRSIRNGQSLSPRGVSQLEDLLLKDKNNEIYRTKLIAYYQSHSFQSEKNIEQYFYHLKWFIKHRPDSSIFIRFRGLHGSSIFPSVAEYSRDVKELWLDKLEQQPGNIKILTNFANYYMTLNTTLTIETLEKARKNFANNAEFHYQLGQAFAQQSRITQSKQSQVAACNSLEEFEKELHLSKTSSYLHYIDTIAQMAVNCREKAKAKFYAEKMLNLAIELSDSERHGDYIHHGNIVLGHIALMDKEISLAEEYLIKAGKTPGSKHLSMFGPNTGLANRLLMEGKTGTILSYLELCKKFCKSKMAEIDKWSDTINKGGIPDWNFYLWR